MAQQINLEVVTPTGSIINKDVDIVNAPGSGGDFGVLANHAPLLSTIKIGALTYEIGEERNTLMVSAGFVKFPIIRLPFLWKVLKQKEILNFISLKWSDKRDIF